MPKIRVLIVDDAVVFRRLVADELSKIALNLQKLVSQFKI